MTKNQQKFMTRKALPIFAYSWLFLAIFGLFENSFIYSYLFANIHKSAVLFAPFFLLFLAYFCLFFSVRPVFFVNGPGGSNKTFLYNTLLATIRSHEDITLAVASSGIL